MHSLSRPDWNSILRQVQRENRESQEIGVVSSGLRWARCAAGVLRAAGLAAAAACLRAHGCCAAGNSCFCCCCSANPDWPFAPMLAAVLRRQAGGKGAEAGVHQAVHAGRPALCAALREFLTVLCVSDRPGYPPSLCACTENVKQPPVEGRKGRGSGRCVLPARSYTAVVLAQNQTLH